MTDHIECKITPVKICPWRLRSTRCDKCRSITLTGFYLRGYSVVVQNWLPATNHLVDITTDDTGEDTFDRFFVCEECCPNEGDVLDLLDQIYRYDP